jgi:hypothetical protein
MVASDSDFLSASSDVMDNVVQSIPIPVCECSPLCAAKFHVFSVAHSTHCDLLVFV